MRVGAVLPCSCSVYKRVYRSEKELVPFHTNRMGLGSLQRLMGSEPRMKDLKAVGNLHMEDCGVQPGRGREGMSGPVGLVFIAWRRRESSLLSPPEQQTSQPQLGFLFFSGRRFHTGSRPSSAVGRAFPVGHIKWMLSENLILINVFCGETLIKALSMDIPYLQRSGART